MQTRCWLLRGQLSVAGAAELDSLDIRARGEVGDETADALAPGLLRQVIRDPLLHMLEGQRAAFGAVAQAHDVEAVARGHRHGAELALIEAEEEGLELGDRGAARDLAQIAALGLGGTIRMLERQIGKARGVHLDLLQEPPRPCA
jgi:hypothetical protein